MHNIYQQLRKLEYIEYRVQYIYAIYLFFPIEPIELFGNETEEVYSFRLLFYKVDCRLVFACMKNKIVCDVEKVG